MDHLQKLQQQVNDPEHVLQTSHLVITDNKDNLFVLYKSMKIIRIIEPDPTDIRCGVFKGGGAEVKWRLSKWNYDQNCWQNIIISKWVNPTNPSCMGKSYKSFMNDYKFNQDFRIHTTVIHNPKNQEYQLFILAVRNDFSPTNALFFRLTVDTLNQELSSIQYMNPVIPGDILLCNISQFNQQLFGIGYNKHVHGIYFVKYEYNKFKVLSDPISIPTFDNDFKETTYENRFLFRSMMSSLYLMIWNSFKTINIYQCVYKAKNNNNNKKKTSRIIHHKIFDVPSDIIESERINYCFIGNGQNIVFFTCDLSKIYLYSVQDCIWRKSKYCFLLPNIKIDLFSKINVLRNEEREKYTTTGFIRQFEKNNKDFPHIPLVLKNIIASFHCQSEYISLLNFNRFNSFDKYHLFSWIIPVDDLF